MCRCVTQIVKESKSAIREEGGTCASVLPGFSNSTSACASQGSLKGRILVQQVWGGAWGSGFPASSQAPAALLVCSRTLIQTPNQQQWPKEQGRGTGVNIPAVTGNFLDCSLSVQVPVLSPPPALVKPPWKAPPSHACTCENRLETGYKGRKTCSETPGRPTAVHPREGTSVSTLQCSFSRRPHYFSKVHVTEVPEAGGPQGAAAWPFLSFVSVVKSSSAESSLASVDASHSSS